jgi:hypothetical protein
MQETKYWISSPSLTGGDLQKELDALIAGGNHIDLVVPVSYVNDHLCQAIIVKSQASIQPVVENKLWAVLPSCETMEEARKLTPKGDSYVFLEKESNGGTHIGIFENGEWKGPILIDGNIRINRDKS